MSKITIEIPEKVLKRASNRRLVVVDPEEFAKDLRMQWETDDAIKASRKGRKEYKSGARLVEDLLELMK